MATQDSNLDRLLRAAACADEPAAAAPFGFDARVVALVRAARGDGNGVLPDFARLVRRIAIVAVFVAAFAGVGAYWQLAENEDDTEPLTNAYAIADTAIDANLLQ